MHSAARARSVMLPCGGALTAAPVSPRRADRSPDFSPTRRPLPIRFCQPARQPGAVPSHFYPHSLRHDAPVFPARCRALLPGFIPIPPRREKFSSPFHTARNNFLGKYKMDETFWAFRVSIYRGACDRDAWPSRRVRRAAPAAAGGSRRNGPARCLGGAHARTGGRNCRTCGETNSPLPARKAERKDTSKMGRYIFRNFLHFFLKHAILTTPLERLRGAARRTGEIRSGSGRAGTGRRTDKTVHFPLRSAATFHPRADGGPKNRRPRTVFPFSICRATGPGRPGANPRTGAHTRSERG